MFDYETLKLIWWVLVGVLLIGFALTDGYDMGAMILLPFVAKTDDERRVAINTIAPHWDGNQVWFITAGGALFAAWPLVYASAFSGMYWALLLVLFALFLRPVGFDYRSKIEHATWRNAWDWALFVGGAVPALVFGVAIGNLFLGLPFTLSPLLQTHYTGSFFALLNPFALLCGIASFCMLAAHGAAWLMLRTEHPIAARSSNALMYSAMVFLVCFLGAGAWLMQSIEGYRIVHMAGHVGDSLNPIAKVVVRTGNAGWLNNYTLYPITLIAPIMAVLGALGAMWFGKKAYAWRAILSTTVLIKGTILTAGFALFPFIMPSSVQPAASLTVWDAVSSQHTLFVMTIAAMIFVPIVLTYTCWCYYKMWGKVTTKHIQTHSHSVY